MERAMSQTIDPRRPAKSESAFRTISEVAEELEVPQHVLRFWETKFSQIRPMKRGGGRRYYRPEDVTLLRRIRTLLYADGFTIKGVQKLLREGAIKNSPDDVVAAVVADLDTPEDAAAADDGDVIETLAVKARTEGLPTKARQEISAVVGELCAVRDLLQSVSLGH
jgi:DNA-binding transcriptional MerR regulator